MINKISTILLGILMVLALGLVFLMPTKAHAEPFVDCVAPSMNVDGSPYIDQGGFRIYAGTSSGVYSNSQESLNPDLCNAPVDLSLGEGSWYVVMTAIDLMGNESLYSNEVLKGYVVAPNPPVLQ